MMDSANHQSTMDELERALVTLKQDYDLLKKDVAELVSENEGHNQDIADLVTMGKELKEERKNDVTSEGKDTSKETKNSSQESRSSDEL